MSDALGGIGDGLDMSLTDLIANARGMEHDSSLQRVRQIGIILKELEAAWLHDPDKRLGQLIIIASRYDDPYNSGRHVWKLPDEDWVLLLRDTWTQA